MIRKIVSRLLIVPLVALGLLVAPAAKPVDAITNCAAPGSFWAWAGPANLSTQLPLGFDCQTTKPSFDTNWADVFYAFRGTDNNNMESYEVQGKVGETWCLMLYSHYNFGDEVLAIRVHNINSTGRRNLPSDWLNIVTSHMVYKAPYGASCVSLV